MNKEQLSELAIVEGIERIVDRYPVTFVLGDNIAFLRWCKDNMLYKHWHVGIVDPPYAIEVGKMMLGASMDGHKAKKYETGKDWDSKLPTQEYWDLLSYCCRNIIAWGGNYFVKELGWAGRCFIFWDKMNDKLSFAPGELALTTYNDRNAVVIRRARNSKTVDDDREKIHSTQKPVYLYDFIHLNFVDKGMRVLDTHGGSHTHAIAAFKNNVNLTIIEAKESYHLDGLKEYEKASMKGRLMF